MLVGFTMEMDRRMARVRHESAALHSSKVAAIYATLVVDLHYKFQEDLFAWASLINLLG